MLDDQHKFSINSYLMSAISLKDNGLIMPNDDFDKFIKKIQDLKLSKHLHSDEVREFIKDTLVKLNCSTYYIKEFFEWSSL